MTSPGRASTTWVVRAFDPRRDWAAACELICTTDAHDGIDYYPTVEDLVHELTNLQDFDPATDMVVAEAEGTGSFTGLATVDWRARGELISHMVNIWVRPDDRRRGLGSELLTWAEKHSAVRVAAGTGGPVDRPHVIGGWGDSLVEGHAQLAAKRGYRPYRYGFEMLRPVAAPVDAHPLPDGLEVRPVEPSQYRAIWDADVEAFRDHFEPATRNESDFQRTFTAPELDTSLWQVAWDGDEVAGTVMTSIYAEENARLGIRRAWLDHISVRRPWRRRGLAASLIASAIRILQERGMEQAALGVDAENPTGALRLYEHLGFVRERTGIGYRKALG
jgi:mycothiol synthase